MKDAPKLTAKKKQFAKVVRGVQISSTLGGAGGRLDEEVISKSEVDRMIQRALSDQAD